LHGVAHGTAQAIQAMTVIPGERQFTTTRRPLPTTPVFPAPQPTKDKLLDPMNFPLTGAGTAYL
jgi:hypothetical protein